MRALAHAHADDADAAPCRCAGAPAARCTKAWVAWMSKMLGCSGTSTWSASFITSSSRLPCRPAGVSSTTCVVPLGGRTMSSCVDLPAADGAAAAAAAAPARWRDDCWRSTSPSITAWPARGQVAGEVGRQRALADAALGIGHHDHRHATSVLACFAVMLPAPAARAGTAAAIRGYPAPPRRRSPIAPTPPTCWCSSPTRRLEQSRVNRALMRQRGAPRRAPARVAGARPVRAVPRLPDRRRRRAGRAGRGPAGGLAAPDPLVRACRR